MVMLAALAAYAVVLAASLPVVGVSHTAYWLAVAAIFVITIAAMWASRFPPAFYGLTSRGASASLASAAVSTAVLAIGGLGVLFAIDHSGSWQAASAPLASTSDAELLAYVVVAAPIQELVFRGLFQSTARQALGGDRRAARLAILISAAAYAASHLPWGVSPALLMLGPGIVWGIQFERDRTLLGVVLSHIVIGYLFVGATPLWTLITA